jgi:hypothetical protein
MMANVFLFQILSLALAATPRALTPSFTCMPAALIDQKVVDCTENELFVAQARLCEQKVSDEVAKEQKKLMEVFSQNESGGQNKQNQRSEHDYRKAADSLEQQIFNAMSATGALRNYISELERPEDSGFLFDDAKENEAYAKDTPCIRDARNEIEKSIAGIEKKRGELEKVKELAKNFLSVSATQKDGLRDHNFNSLPASAAPPADGSKPVPRPGYRNSDISKEEDPGTPEGK